MEPTRGRLGVLSIETGRILPRAPYDDPTPLIVSAENREAQGYLAMALWQAQGQIIDATTVPEASAWLAR